LFIIQKFLHLNTCIRKLTVHIVPVMPLPGIHWKIFDKMQTGKNLGKLQGFSLAELC
jgi:hypothetical protein